MPFTVIKGTFHVVNYSPDGDSIRFKPDDAATLRLLSGPPARANARGHVQLRIEAIDTLETHYTPPSGGGVFAQPPQYARAAADALMEFAGIGNVRWSPDGKSVVAAEDGTRGYLLAREVEKNRRPVAFVFAGDPDEADGSPVMLDAARLQDSYNYQAVSRGLAYATYYTGLFADLRAALSAAVLQARANGLGLYAVDATTTPFAVDGLDSLTTTHVVMPKLFRRMVEYLASEGSIVGFKQVLEQAQEPVLDLRTQNFTHFDTFVEQERGANVVCMTRAPEELVFGPMKERIGSPFSLALGQAADDAMA